MFWSRAWIDACLRAATRKKIEIILNGLVEKLEWKVSDDCLQGGGSGKLAVVLK